MLSSLIKYIKKCQEYLSAIHRQEGLSMCFLWIDSIWSLLVYGCTIRHYRFGRFYKLRHFERKKVFTTRKFFKFVAATNSKGSIPILEDKEKFNDFFKDFVHRKWIDSNTMDLDRFKSLYQACEKIIVKPLAGTEGQGISIIDCKESSDESLQRIYDGLKKQNVIIEEVVKQHHYMCFNSKAVNTIRAMSLMDKKTGDVSVLKTVIRVGAADAIVDNFHQGGCVYEVDLDSGRICSAGLSTNGEAKIFHPGTNICMLGYQIPNWDKVINGCIQAHKQLPECRYIAWDVAITDNDIELIEGNHNGDYDMFEFVGKGLWWPVLKKYI